MSNEFINTFLIVSSLIQAGLLIALILNRIIHSQGRRNRD